MLREPTVSATQIAFIYGGDIWIADRDGADPRRITSHPAVETRPKFSPDGSMLAFSANYDGNTDVYVISTSGGQAKRLTFHPSADQVSGWSADGSAVLFSSTREVAMGRTGQLYHVALEGGLPEKIMKAVAAEGAWSDDGSRLAYRPYWAAHGGSSGWRLHRGGATPPIWIIDPQSNEVEKIPHPRANETNPMWSGDTVYYISDRDNTAANLFAYNTRDKSVTQLTEESSWDVRAASIYNDTIVYEAGGRLKTLNTNSNRITELAIQVSPDAPQTLPGWKDASSNITNIALSPTAQRALITARGDVFTIPLENGSTRNITATGGVRESGALWSPEGDKIAYVSDQGSVHQLVVVDQTGRGEEQVYPLGDTDYYSLLAWGAEGERLIYEDNHLGLYTLDLRSGEHTLIRTEARRSQTAIALSPDGEWLVYNLSLPSVLNKFVLYNFASGEHTDLTDGMSFVGSPVFSRDGKYLYFTGSTNAGPVQVGLDMSTQERPLRSAIYAAVLASDGKSPLLPRLGDEEVVTDDVSSDESEEAAVELVVQIDPEGIQSRFVALPVAERFYTDLSVTDDGDLLFLERQQAGVTNEPPSGERRAVNTLRRFDFEERESSQLAEGIVNYNLSADGKTLLLMGRGGSLSTAAIAAELKPEPLSTADVKMYIDPRDEWAQIFDEVWRMEHQFFYAENMHGIDWPAIKEKYAELLPHVATRSDLNYLMREMIAELQVGHNRVSGGDIYRAERVPVGLLGADLRIENNRYRIEKIYTGESWNPFLVAPLAAPGLGVAEGDYILAVNGISIDGSMNIYSLLAQTVGEHVALLVSSDTSDADAMEIIVEPIGSESALRQWNWIEANRKYVEEQTDGKVGYVYLPDTAAGGYTYFNRLFFAQVDKQALIIDERRNGGGQAANYITDVLGRNYLASWKDRDGLIFDTPSGAVYGPKVMLVDQNAGSGGDFLPYSFKYQGLGTLIGTTTWGGLIGISANPNLIDGGNLVVPFFRFFNPEGEWRIENEGVDPDIEIQLEPDQVNIDVDTQLDLAISEVLEQLDNYNPIKQPVPPALPTVLGQ